MDFSIAGNLAIEDSEAVGKDCPGSTGIGSGRSLHPLVLVLYQKNRTLRWLSVSASISWLSISELVAAGPSI